MFPGASVCGVYFGHPEAKYFSLGKIDRDQVEDYAARKGMTVAEIERWLSPNLNYDSRGPSMLALASLSPLVLRKIETCRWDRIIEKHEGPETWASTLLHDTPEFIEIAGYSVLLPISAERHPNVTILRCTVSVSGDSLTVFLKDTTYCNSCDDAPFCAGYMAVCDRIAGEEFFVAVLCHEWFIIENTPTSQVQ